MLRFLFALLLGTAVPRAHAGHMLLHEHLTFYLTQ